jgi:hypothetical protein
MLGQHVLPDVHLRLLLRVVVAGKKWGIAKVEQCSCSLCEMVCFGNEIGNHFWRPRRGMEINIETTSPVRGSMSGMYADVQVTHSPCTPSPMVALELLEKDVEFALLPSSESARSICTNSGRA